MTKLCIEIDSCRTAASLINFFIKSKDECMDPFVLFDDNSANFILHLVDLYNDFVSNNAEESFKHMRPFKIFLNACDPYLETLQAKFIEILNSDTNTSTMLITKIKHGNLSSILRTYFAPFNVEESALHIFQTEIMQMLEGKL